jgi:RNA polymerase sigma factor (sigma-70 family)
MNDRVEPYSVPDGPTGCPIDWASTLVRHDRWLRTVVAARLGERQAVDEVLQEVSLAAVGTKVLIDPARVAGWLYRLAIRKTLLYRRSRGRQHKLVDRYAKKVRDLGDPTPDPLGWLLLDERMELVREALGKLHARDSEILLLKYTENWSCRDLADHLGQTESAIESRLHRARQRLREELVRSSMIEVRP